MPPGPNFCETCSTTPTPRVSKTPGPKICHKMRGRTSEQIEWRHLFYRGTPKSSKNKKNFLRTFPLVRNFPLKVAPNFLERSFGAFIEKVSPFMPTWVWHRNPLPFCRIKGRSQTFMACEPDYEPQLLRGPNWGLLFPKDPVILKILRSY